MEELLASFAKCLDKETNRKLGKAVGEVERSYTAWTADHVKVREVLRY